MKTPSQRRACAFSAALTLFALSACKVMSIEEDRALRERRSENFDAAGYVSSHWDTAVLPELEKRAVEFSQLHESKDIEEAGRRFGRQAGDGSPWTVVTGGRGTVTAIDRESLEGTIELIVPTRGGPTEVLLQTGPVIVDNSIRDALPFLTFNDFSGQVAFAEVGRALTLHALAETQDTLGDLKLGDRVEFLGTFNLTGGVETSRLTVVRLSRPGQGEL